MNDDFRKIDLPNSIKGSLFLHHMPARYEETLDGFKNKAQEAGIDTILCLCSRIELEQKSPEYAHAVASDTLGYALAQYPIPDFGTPKDIQSFIAYIRNAAHLIQSGKNSVLHCGAGIGRTGMTASCILTALGIQAATADLLVENAGSRAEEPEQIAFIAKVRKELGQ